MLVAAHETSGCYATLSLICLIRHEPFPVSGWIHFIPSHNVYPRHAEQLVSNRNGFGSCFERPDFKCLLGHRLCWLSVFVVSLSRSIMCQYPAPNLTMTENPTSFPIYFSLTICSRSGSLFFLLLVTVFSKCRRMGCFCLKEITWRFMSISLS
jgi:hypothetical protein